MTKTFFLYAKDTLTLPRAIEAKDILHAIQRLEVKGISRDDIIVIAECPELRIEENENDK
jgi:hypothetical protein